MIIEAKEEESAAMSLIENLQREDLHYLEEAYAYERLINEFGISQTQLAQNWANLNQQLQTK